MNGNQAQAQQQNVAARRALLMTGTPMRKNVGTFGPYSPGQQAQIQLLNVGVLTSLDLVITAFITITVAATIGSVGAEALIPVVKFTDFDQTDRINISGRQLKFVNSIRQRNVFNAYSVTDIVDSPAVAAIGNSLLTVVPTGVVAPGAANFRMDVHVPLAYDPNSDLRGAVLAQTIRGNQFVKINFAQTVFGADNDSLYKAGTGSVANIFVTVYQNFIMPQKIGNALPLPQQDLLTVYELAGTLQLNAGLAVNQAAHVYYPNVRQVIGCYLTYMNGGVLNYGTDLASLIVQANANTNLREYTNLDLLSRIRNHLGVDFLPGCYYLDTRRVPVDTQLFGNVQALFTPSAVSGGNTYVEMAFEDFYLKGTALPGVNVA